VGVTFALGWTPCIGPILGSILVLAGTSGSMLTGIYLLAAYALGLGIPFLIAGVAFPQFIARMRRINPYLNLMAKGSGVLLILIGILLVTNLFGYLTGWVNTVVPTMDLERFLTQ
jgi:cytochrome c-type biogenesis protein